MRLLDRLHDEARLQDSRFRVIGVVGEGRNNSLSVDVAAFVHEPAWRFGRQTTPQMRRIAKKTCVRERKETGVSVRAI